MTNKQRDYACSVLFLIFGIFMFIQSLSIHSMMDKDVGSGFVPKIVAMAIIVISAIKLLLTFLSKKSEEAKKSDEDIMGGLLNIVLLAIYVVLFKPLGFILSTFIYLFFQITLLSTEKNRNLILFGIISVVAPVVIYALFVYVIKMPLPTGLLSF